MRHVQDVLCNQKESGVQNKKLVQLRRDETRRSLHLKVLSQFRDLFLTIDLVILICLKNLRPKIVEENG